MSFMKITAEDVPDIPSDFDDVFSKEDDEHNKLSRSEGENYEDESYSLNEVVEKAPGENKLHQTISNNLDSAHDNRNDYTRERTTETSTRDKAVLSWPGKTCGSSHAWMLHMFDQAKIILQFIFREASELSSLLQTARTPTGEEVKQIQSHCFLLDKVVKICRSIGASLQNVRAIAMSPAIKGYEDPPDAIAGRNLTLEQAHKHLVDATRQIQHFSKLLIDVLSDDEAIKSTITVISSLRIHERRKDIVDRLEYSHGSVSLAIGGIHHNLAGQARSIITYMDHANWYIEDLKPAISDGSVRRIGPEPIRVIFNRNIEQKQILSPLKIGSRKKRHEEISPGSSFQMTSKRKEPDGSTFDDGKRSSTTNTTSSAINNDELVVKDIICKVSTSSLKPSPIVSRKKKKTEPKPATVVEYCPPNGRTQFTRREATLILANKVPIKDRATTIKTWIAKNYVPIRQTSLYKLIREYEKNGCGDGKDIPEGWNKRSSGFRTDVQNGVIFPNYLPHCNDSMY